MAFAPNAWADLNQPAGEWHLDALNCADACSTPDSSGNGNTARASTSDTPTVVAGHFGNAASFNAAAGNQLYIPVATPTRLEPGFPTVMAWVKALAPGTNRYIISKGNDGNCAGASFALRTVGPNGDLEFYVWEGLPHSVVESPAVSGAQVWDGQWHAVAGVYDGNAVRLYVDGHEIGNGTPFTGTIDYALADRTLTLGNYAWNQNFGCDATQFAFNGAIDEARIYERPLSPDELAYLQTQTAPGGSPPELPIPSTTTTTSTTSTASTSTSTQVGPVPPQAGFTAPAPQPAGTLVTLNALATTGASQLAWDINGDGRTDATCDARQPVLEVRLPRTATVKLTALSATGASSQISHVVQATGTGPPAGSARYLNTAVCLSPNSLGVDLTADGGPPAGCTTSVEFELVNAIGCLDSVTDPAAVPSAEAPVLTALFRDFQTSHALHGYLDWYCENVAHCSREIVSGRGLATRFLAQSTGLYVSRETVRINGVDFTPLPGARIVLAPALGRIVSSRAVVKVGGVPVQVGAVNLDVTDNCIPNCVVSRADIASFDSRDLPVVGGFPFSGQATLRFIRDSGQFFGEIAGQLSLGRLFGGLTVNAVFRFGNASGFVLQSFKAHLDNLGFEGFGLQDINISYDHAIEQWIFQGAIGFAGTSIRMDPPPDYNGIVFQHGRLVSAGATLQFRPPTPAPEPFPGVEITDINFGFYTDPLALFGGVTMRVLGLADVNGRMVTAFPSNAVPFHLTRGTFPGLPQRVYDHAFTTLLIGVGGTVSVEVPHVATLNLGSGYFVYNYPAYIAAGASVGETFFDLVTIRGSIDGEFNAANKRFNLEGNVEACLPDPIGCGSATGVVSSGGIGACLGDIGGGFQWASFPSPFIYVGWPGKDCDPDRFRDDHVFSARDVRGARVTATQAAQRYVVQLRRGQPNRVIELDGAGGAPNVELSGPVGQTLRSASPTTILKSRSMFVAPIPKLSRTIVVFASRLPGTYTITPLPGPAIVRSRHANQTAPARVRGTVSGRGLHRLLRYDILRRPGQRVRFLDTTAHGQRGIATVVGGGRGAVRFTTAPGPDEHRVIADISLDGMTPPSEQNLPVASFRPPPFARPGSPRWISARFVRGVLTIRWAAADAAASYDIAVSERAGMRVRRQLGSAARRVTLRGLAPWRSGTVTIRAVGAGGVSGRSRTVRYEAGSRPPRRFLRYSELRTGRR